MRWRAAAARLAIVLAIGVFTGCLHRRGDWTNFAEAPPPKGFTAGATLVVLGNAGWAGRNAAHVAEHLRDVLELESSTGVAPLVLWLGDNVMARRRPDASFACPSAQEVWQRRGRSELYATVRAHMDRGHPSHAIAGEHDWRCASVSTSDDQGRDPWTMPAHHYVVAIRDDGSTSIASRCDERSCRYLPPQQDRGRKSRVVLELVMLDTTPWIHREVMSKAAADHSLRMLSSLLEAVQTDASESAPPRVLVSHYPVEAAGWHGQGGGGPDSSWPFLHPAVQDALRRGMFIGVLAAHDHGLYADADISAALKRSDRVWLPTPAFQVVSASASLRASGLRRLRHFGSVTLLPDLYSPGPGLAVVRIAEEEIEIILHARRFGRWQTSSLSLPLRPAPHGPQTPSPAMSPCLRCAEVPANERP